MKSTYTVLATALVGAAGVMAGGPMTPEGCYSSTAGMTLNGTNPYNSMGACGGACLGIGSATFAMYISDCYCGQTLPPASAEIDNSTCSHTCPGYPPDLCGGSSAFSVYLTGLLGSAGNSNVNANNINPSSSQSSAVAVHTPSATPSPTPAPTISAAPSVVTVGGQTIVVTASAQLNSATSSSTPISVASTSSGPSKASIAAGAVVGVVALLAIAGGLFLFFRNKARREIEDEYRRQAAVNTFVGAGRPPTSEAGFSFTDTRLDPAAMAQRRMSDGSIADNQDYSRRILKVTNV